jgi:hypothetical protein
VKEGHKKKICIQIREKNSNIAKFIRMVQNTDEVAVICYTHHQFLDEKGNKMFRLALRFNIFVLRFKVCQTAEALAQLQELDQYLAPADEFSKRHLSEEKNT